MADAKDRRSKMPTSSVNAPAKKGGGGGMFTWGKAEDVQDFEPVGDQHRTVSVDAAAASPAGTTLPPEAGAAAVAPPPDRNDSTEFPSLKAATAALAPLHQAPSKKDVASTLQQKEAVARALCIANAFFMTGVTMVVPARAPMVLSIKKGDVAGTARTMGLMSSCAAVIELLINPVFSRLSDKYGRKPFLVLAPIVDAVLHIMVAAFPRALPVTFVDRMITGSFIFCFLAPLHAAISDLFGTGQKLAENLARSASFFGIGCALGPFVGARLGGSKAFAASAGCFLVTCAWLLVSVPETLREERKKEFNIAACSPFRFLKLFQGKMTSALSLTLGLQSFGDYVNIYDINFLYLKSVMGYGQAEVGNFATAIGIAQIASGELTRGLIQRLGQKSTVMVTNAGWMLAMALLGTSRTATQLAVAIAAVVLGYNRSTPVSAYLQKHGQVAGLGAAEIQGAAGNLTAILKVFVPIIFGNLFSWATSKGRNLPGAPYFLICGLTALSQAVIASINPDAAEKA